MLLLLMLLRPFPLREYFSGVEFHQHGAVSLELFDGDGEAEIVEKKKLEFEMVEFDEWEASDLQRSSELISIHLMAIEF